MLSKIINDLVKNIQPSGIILIGRDNNEIIYTQSFGFADLSTNTHNTIDTQYLIGSVTKQFTAVAILKAIYEQAMQSGIGAEQTEQLKTYIIAALHKPITAYLPVTNSIWAGAMPEWANSVTIYHLLIHSAGIVNYVTLPEFPQLERQQCKAVDIVNLFKKYELEFTPGTKHAYSNSGYFLLGIIAQQITGIALDVYLALIFQTLTMYSSYLVTEGMINELKQFDYRAANLACGYNFNSIEQTTSLTAAKDTAAQIYGGAGGMISTAIDLLKWNTALYAGKIIPKFLVELMLFPHIAVGADNEFYGYGTVIVNSDALGVYYYHNGGIPGFKSNLAFIPKLKLSIVCLTNVAEDTDKLMLAIKAIEAKLPATLSQEEKSQQIEQLMTAKYPMRAENQKKFNFMLINKAAIEALDKPGSWMHINKPGIRYADRNK